MKTVLLVTAILMSASARADVNPAIPFINFVGNVIQDKINDHNGNNVDLIDLDDEDVNYNKVILLDQGNKIILGQLTIDEEVGMDSFTLPKCHLGDNKPVSQIRFAVKKNDVTIDTIRVTFQNGKTQVIDVSNDYSNGEKTEWFALKGLKDRCIQKIRVTGSAFHQWDGGDSDFNGPGNHGPGGHIGFGGGGIDIDINLPGHGGNNHGPGNHGPGGHDHYNNSKSVLQVIGLKS
jgi:hypothetical protein